MKKLTTFQKYIYGVGVAYFVLDQVFNQWLNYFYLPPDTGTNLKPILTSKMIFIGFVIIRIIDAVSDLIIGYMSDNSKAKMGKRSYFMFLGGVPLSLSMVLFFFPPNVSNQYIILTYFVIVGSIYFVSYTLVGGPYNAMIADFSKTKEDRLNLSTIQSIFRLVFTAIPLVLAGKLIAYFSGEKPNTYGIRMSVIIFSVLAVIGIYACIFLLKEREIVGNSDVVEHKEKIGFKTILSAISHKQVIYYFIGFFLFFSGFNVIRNILPYFVTLIMQKGPGEVTKISAIMFGASAVFFIITKKLAEKFGNRKVMVANLITIVIPAVILTIYTGTLKGNDTTFIYLMFAIIGAGFSGSAFIFPPAMLSDICHSIKTVKNINIDGVMFGIQGFFLKLAFLLQAAVTTLGIVYKGVVDANGKQAATKEGVYLSIIISVILLLLSAFFYFINDKQMEDENGNEKNCHSN